MAAGPSSALLDTVFGTRSRVEGAQIQLPRKIPLRVEPKSFFANERTFLSWIGMAVSLGGVASLLMGVNNGQGGGIIQQETVNMITLIMAPLSILLIIYALFTFYWRNLFMKKKQVGFFDDRMGPSIICVLVMATLIFITCMALRDYLFT